MALQGPVFAPAHRDEFYAIVGERYALARSEAEALGASKRIKMRVEFLKPVHLNISDYTLPTGDTKITLEDNCALFPYGILTWDSSFDYMKWWTGNKVSYIADWFTLPVYYYQEKQGAYKGNLRAFEFRAGETLTFNVHSTTSPTPSTVNAWLLAFAVLPATKAEEKIIK